MGFFNDLGKKTTEATSKIAREAKLKMKITENRSKTKSLYEELGRKVYENHIRENDTNLKEIVKDDCIKIDTLSKETEEARKQILTINNKKLCNNCFAEIEVESMFCPKCGKKQNEAKTVLEKAEEKLETAEIPQGKEDEAEIVKEELKEKNDENNKK